MDTGPTGTRGLVAQRFFYSATNGERQNRFTQCVYTRSYMEAPFDPATSERLKKENGFLLRIYRAAFAKDPTSRATESARSNLIALRHTVRQVYGERAAVDVTDVLGFISVAACSAE